LRKVYVREIIHALQNERKKLAIFCHGRIESNGIPTNQKPYSYAGILPGNPESKSWQILWKHKALLNVESAQEMELPISTALSLLHSVFPRKCQTD